MLYPIVTYIRSHQISPPDLIPKDQFNRPEIILRYIKYQIVEAMDHLPKDESAVRGDNAGTELADSKAPEVSQSGLIDTTEAVSSLVDALCHRPNNPPSLYIDLEGVDLSRIGTISILQVYLLPTNETYLVDVRCLGSAAFTTSGVTNKEMTLQSILQSDQIIKAFFDVRNDSDALYSHYGIDLAGICDIQLMELATRSGRKKMGNGLARCIERDAPFTWQERQEWGAVKEAGKKLFAPERGGSYEVFNHRPMSQEMIIYCKKDVQILPRLWQTYSAKMSSTWAAKVEAATKDRVKLSQSATFVGQGRHMALGPW
ncbi:unnamed protein product [Periconia digitata]|uniref:3'-5' exonuclease domain-containing protein n=1 Tax=Periconia digitata TaxID=1303443 RepID=A0A9W4XK24_9PLEO|nr:unnamed protein product [Periconia digitata]